MTDRNNRNVSGGYKAPGTLDYNLRKLARQSKATASSAFSGAYVDLSGKPTLGTAAAQDVTAFDAAGVAAAGDAAHVGAGDPHPQYATDSDLAGHTGNTSNPHSVTKTQVGLGSVDNTADASKPVSTAQAASIATKAASSITIGTTAPLAGGGNLTANRTLTIAAATTSVPGSMSAADKTKLDGVANGATANSADVVLLARANHTGTQTKATISDLETLAAGTYTPTITGVTNVTATTAYDLQYMRVGGTVTVSGRVDVQPTAGASTNTRVAISLPVASNFTGLSDAAGTGVIAQGTAYNVCVIAPDTTNDRADLFFYSTATANAGCRFHFTYRII